MVLEVFEPFFASYWNRKWPKNTVSYVVKKGERIVMTNFLKECVVDPAMMDVFRSFESMYPTYARVSTERLMWMIERFVIKTIHYKRDKNVWNQVEYWQTPTETWKKRTGDCEDGAILILALAHYMGIDAYRLKLCAGYVKLDKKGKLGGHAYIIFLRNDMTWTICDWCYWPKRQLIEHRMEHRYNPSYSEIWWTSNWQFSWAQQNVWLGFEGFEIR